MSYSSFDTIKLENNKFTSNLQFLANSINYTYINNNTFEKTDFRENNFGKEIIFKENLFEGVALFSSLLNKKTTYLTLERCIFKDYSDFNNSNLYGIKIDNCTFLEASSFQDVEIDSMILDRTIFKRLVFFDGLSIRSIKKCDQRTIRNIKQQLQRADNKIDYDKFRAYELNSYQETLRRKINQDNVDDKLSLRQDLVILKINEFYSNNGTDWVRAIIVTILVGLVFYNLFFISTNFDKNFSISEYNQYFNGLFRFFLITDFYNPLTDEKEYLKEVINWIPFILGKIFIAIGIYEAIVSFRKFKK